MVGCLEMRPRGRNQKAAYVYEAMSHDSQELGIMDAPTLAVVQAHISSPTHRYYTHTHVVKYGVIVSIVVADLRHLH